MKTKLCSQGSIHTHLLADTLSPCDEYRVLIFMYMVWIKQ